MSFGSRSLPKPSPEQLARWVEAYQKGCVMPDKSECGGALQQHHLKSGNLRMGHWFTVCLCERHHERAAELTKKFGNETLMYWQDNLLGYVTPRIRERNRKTKCLSSKMLPRR